MKRLLFRLICLSVAIDCQVAAQPRITAQPRHISVRIGQDAQFTVSASGTAPLMYQWRSNGADLSGETNRMLVITNVSLSHLGRIDVIVGNSAGSATSDAASLLLARWTELVVFGRSVELPRCGGVAWPNYLANRLGIRLRNYAAGGLIPGLPSSWVQSQITTYLANSNPTTNTLIGLWLGGCDLWVLERPVEEAVANQLALMRRLLEAGARHVLLPRVPLPELVPFWVERYPSLTSETVVAYDALLDNGLKELQMQFPVTIYRPDMFAFFTAIAENPIDYGLREPLGTDFLCDTAHFTPAVHDLIGEQFHASLTPALEIASIVQRQGDEVLLRWIGGSPPFRLEATSDLLSGQWQQIGELTFVNSISVRLPSSRGFFRVEGLGQ